MSRHSHSRVWSDIQNLSREELESLYGIHIEDDGSVWDTLEHQGFATLAEWAAFTESQDDEYEDCSSMNKRHRFDDEY